MILELILLQIALCSLSFGLGAAAEEFFEHRRKIKAIRAQIEMNEKVFKSICEDIKQHRLEREMELGVVQ